MLATNCRQLARREGSFSRRCRSEQSNSAGLVRRERSADFLLLKEARLRGVADPAVLALAAEQGRVLVSHDVSTLPLHFRAFRSAGNRSPGVFLVPQSLGVGLVIDELLLIWLASEAEEWGNRLVWLPL